MTDAENRTVENLPSRYYFMVEKLATFLLLIYPAAMLVAHGGMNGVFFLMLLLAMAVRLVRPKGLGMSQWDREWTVYAVAMAGLTLAILLSQIYHQSYSPHPHDAASRFWLAIPVLLLLQRLRPRVFIVLQYAFPVAAITGFIMAILGGTHLEGRLTIVTMDLIHFGDFELMLGMLSLASINWFGRDTLPLRILKVLGLVAGVVSSFASGSRGGWLAIPVFVALLFYFKAKKPSPRLIVQVVVATTLIVGLLYTFSATFQNRVNEVANDIMLFGEGKRDTSTGIRWQLYQVAAEVFVNHPLFGVGPEGFAKEMQPMAEAGKLTPIAAEIGRGEVHNDILSKAAGMGIFGLAAILSIYLVPLRLFWRASKSALREVSRAGMLGLVFVSGFFIFGLTVEVLDLAMAVAFYGFTVAVLLAACYNIHYRAPIQPNKDNHHV